MRKNTILILLLALVLGVSIMPVAAAVDPARLARLARGVNINEWFWGYEWAQDPNSTLQIHLESHFGAADFELLRSIGMTHVRFPIDPALFFDADNPGTLKPLYLDELDAAVDTILTADLAVIIDMHVWDDVKRGLAFDDAYVTKFATYWQALTTHFSGLNPEMVFFETVNEPAFGVFQDSGELPNAAQRWQEVQGKLLLAMREGAPNHTFIAKGYTWDGIDGLLALTPYADENIVYNVHFYSPFTFTHQGAEWVDFDNIKGVPYPASGDEVRQALNRVSGYPSWAIYDADQDWNRDTLLDLLQPAFDWAEDNSVPLTVNEFGVHRPFAVPAMRNYWYADMVEIMEANGVGWAMWDYDASFGLVQKDNTGARHLDINMALAMGLLDSWGTLADFAPIDGYTTNDAAVTFSWPAHPNADSYRILMGAAPETLVEVEVTTNVQQVLNLLPATFYWRIEVIDGGSTIAASQVRRLTVNTSAGSAVPLRSFISDTRTPTLTWSRLTWANGYQVQIDDNPNFQRVNRQSGLLTNTQYTPDAIYPLPNGTWYWRVRGFDGARWQAWSSVETFTIISST